MSSSPTDRTQLGVVRSDVNDDIAVHVAKNELNIDGKHESGEVSEGILGKESH